MMDRLFFDPSSESERCLAAARNTIVSWRITIWLANHFGKKEIVFDGEENIVLSKFFGKEYLIDREKTNEIG